MYYANSFIVYQNWMLPGAEIISTKATQHTENKTPVGTVVTDEDIRVYFYYLCFLFHLKYK